MMCMFTVSLFPTYVYIISSYSCRYFPHLYRSTLFIEHYSVESPFECMCCKRAYSFLCAMMCIDVQIKYAAKCQLSKIYKIFIRKLLCDVTLSRHFHLFTTALNALCSMQCAWRISNVP